MSPTRAVVAATALCTLLVGAALWHRSRPALARHLPLATPSTVRVSGSGSADEPAPSEHDEPAEEPFGVVIEPEAPCRGTDALVRVLLPDADPSTTVFIGGSLGNPAIVRASRPDSRRIPIEIFRGSERIASASHTLPIQQCDHGDSARLVVAARRLGENTVEAVTVIRRELDVGPLRWDFGDGHVVERDARAVEHAYAFPEAPWTTHVITVTGRAESGRPLMARAHFGVRRRGLHQAQAIAELQRTLAEREAEQAAARAEERTIVEEEP